MPQGSRPRQSQFDAVIMRPGVPSFIDEKVRTVGFQKHLEKRSVQIKDRNVSVKQYWIGSAQFIVDISIFGVDPLLPLD